MSGVITLIGHCLRYITLGHAVDPSERDRGFSHHPFSSYKMFICCNLCCLAKKGPIRVFIGNRVTVTDGTLDGWVSLAS
jgi:hypothetical protein